MDVWKPFIKATREDVLQAVILFDKFHVLRQLGVASNEVGRREFARLKGKDRAYIKGQRFTSLSRWASVSSRGKRTLKRLLKANKRLNAAYLLRETFGQLSEYQSETRARNIRRINDEEENTYL